MRILVLAPHPDDDLIGCGGSLIKHEKAGAIISIAYITSGEAGSKSLGTIRESEAIKACAQLGINANHLHFLHESDGGIVVGPKIVSEVVEIIRKGKPDIIYLPHKYDNHPDHLATHQIGVKAIEQAGMSSWNSVDQPWSAGTVLAYEVWTPLRSPQYLEDTTSVIEQLTQALSFHVSQLEIIAYDDMVRSLGRYRGLLLGNGHYAEAFEVLSINPSSLSLAENDSSK